MRLFENNVCKGIFGPKRQDDRMLDKTAQLGAL